jgi:hypothetical protein
MQILYKSFGCNVNDHIVDSTAKRIIEDLHWNALHCNAFVEYTTVMTSLARSMQNALTVTLILKLELS